MAAAKRVKPAKPELFAPETKRILAQFPLRLAVDFSQFFTDVCVRGGDLRQIVLVLVAWMGRGGQAVVQGRGGEWSYHFICGAACQLNFGLGFLAAVMNEQFSVDQDSEFDRDDMALAIAGAEWVAQVQRNPQWLADWKSGRLTLAKNLPPIHYGRGAYSMPIFQRVYADIQAAYSVHDETPNADLLLAGNLQR